MKKITFLLSFLLCFLFYNYSFSQISGPETINFDVPDNTDLGSTPQDGDGGSTNITGVNITIRAIDATGAPTGANLFYNVGLAMGFEEGISVGTDPATAAWRGLSIKSDDGSEFDFNGFESWEFAGVGAVTLNVRGYKNGVPTGTGSTPLLTANADRAIFTSSNFPNADFGNVDEVRIIAQTDYYGTFDVFFFGAAVIPDTTPPVFENSTPSSSNITSTGFTLNTDIDEAGTIYYVIVTDGATAPTSIDVKNGDAGGCGGFSLVTSGNAAVTTGDFTHDFNVSGLTINTGYDVYVVAEDTAGNLQVNPTKIDVTAVNSPPTFTSTAVTSLNEGDTYTYTITTNDADGDNVTVTAPTKPSWMSLTAQTEYLVSTFAGSKTGNSGDADGIGTAALFDGVHHISLDATGNMYVTDKSNHKIKKITPEGVVSTFAGSTQGSGDGTGTNAQFNSPVGVVLDATGNVYISDQNNHKIRKITPTGVVSTFAGSGNIGTTDGTGMNASFNYPFGLAIDASDNIYVADWFNHRIRKITPTGVVSTLAGGSQGYQEGTGTSARFSAPRDVAVDTSGNVYVADGNNDMIRKISPAGVVTSLAGKSGESGTTDGLGSTARFWRPHGVAVDAKGNVFVADRSNHLIRKISPIGLVTTVAGSYDNGPGTTDGLGSVALFDQPTGIAIDGEGNLFIVDEDNNSIRKMTPPGQFTLSGNTTGNAGDHSVVLEANDGNGGTVQQAFTVTVVAPPTVTLSVDNASIDEASGTATLTATLSKVYTKDVTVTLGYTGTAVNGTDYNSTASTSITITAGQTSADASVIVTPINDTDLEVDETIIVDITGVTNATENGTQQKTITIEDNDTATLSVNTISKAENADGGATTDFTYIVTLTGDTSSGFSVDYATDDIDAVAGTDYTATSGTLNFAGNDGETQQFTVTVNNDDVAEFDETFSVQFSNLQAGGLPITIPSPSIATIDNDDTAILTIADVSGNEDDGAITVTVTLDKGVQGGFSVSVSTADGSATVANSDYTAIDSQQISFTGTAGETKTFTVTPTADTTTEFDETLTVSMQLPQRNGSAGVDASDTAEITITNDDIATITIEDVSGNEDDGPITVTATLDNDIQGGFTIAVSTADGTATLANNDYTALVSQFVAFTGTAGETQTFTVTPVADAITEDDETVSIFMQIPARSNSLIVDATDTATVTILDDDAPVVTSVSVPTDGVYGIGQDLGFTVTFSSAVSITGSPSIPVTIGNTTVQASLNGSFTNSLTADFRYTVVEGDADTDGIAVGTDINLNGGTIEDTSNRAAILTLNSVASTANVNIDGIKPTVVISSIASDPTNTAFDVTITFSEPVTGFDVTDIDIGNGSASSFSATSASVYTATITPASDGGVTVLVFEDLAQDAAGNGNEISNEFFVEYDATNPTIAITTTAVSPVNAPFNITVTFSEDVTGFELADLAVTNGTASAFVATSASVYTATIIPSGATNIIIDIAAGSAEDDATNPNDSGQLAVAYDNIPPVAPTITHISDYTCSGNVTMTGDNTLEISGTAEQGSTIEVFQNGVSIGTVTTTNAGFFTFDHTGTTLADGTYNFTVTATDAANNTSALSAPLTITIDSLDTDGDGLPDFCDPDDDGNGVDDEDEDCDGDGIIDSIDTDNSACASAITQTKQYGFSPNGDGVNDGWYIENITAYPNSVVQVYSRSGKLVFKKKGYQNDWTGVSNQISNSGTENRLPVGPYLFIIDLGNGTKPTRGWIYINY